MLWPADLSARADRAEAMLRDCRLCSRNCGVDRSADARTATERTATERTATERTTTDSTAWCGLGADAHVYKELLSYGEEHSITPTWLLDLSGCSLRCLFCTEWRHITEPTAAPAIPLRADWFVRRLRHHATGGASTISFVGGEPTVNLPAILRVLASAPTELQLPIVWNSNGLIGDDAMALLRGLVHTWIIDLKVRGQDAARRLLGAGELAYEAAVGRSLDMIHADLTTTSSFSPEMLVIRHLLMPGRITSDTLPLLDEISTRWPNATVNLMTMYLPFGPALGQLSGASALKTMLTTQERGQAINAARGLQLRLLIDGQR